MSSARDPFYSVKDKIQSQLSLIRLNVDNLHSLQPVSSSPPSSDYISCSKLLKSQLLTISIDLSDLSKTIQIVETHRDRFPQIDERELTSRRVFVDETKQLVNNYQQDVKKAKQIIKEFNKTSSASSSSSAASTASGSALDQRRALLGPSSSSTRFNSSIDQDAHRSRDDRVQSARQQQLQQRESEDAELITMEAALKRLENLAGDTSSVLKQHEHMLNEVDDEMTDAQNNMNTVLKKLDKLLKTSDKGRICCILILFAIAVLLFFLIIYA